VSNVAKLEGDVAFGSSDIAKALQKLYMSGQYFA
tara:strand:+ start:2520 stop:2621 length:102 start_codon:yes stop_codon:yes gene_type:complete